MSYVKVRLTTVCLQKDNNVVLICKNCVFSKKNKEIRTCMADY